MIVFFRSVLFFFVLILNCAGLSNSQTPLVKITTDLLPVEKSLPLDQINWHEPFTSVIYCVSHSPVTHLEFVCPKCDPSIQRLLSDQTQDMSANAGYPAIKLRDMKMNATHWRNADRLECIGSYDSSTVKTESLVNVNYLRAPVIVTEFDHLPISDLKGNKFYFNEERPLKLMCKADSNPPVEHFRWFSDGIPSSEVGSTLHVTKDFVGKTISCVVQNVALSLTADSQPVLIENLIGPNSVSTNFESLHRDGIIHPGNNAVPVGTSVDLQCAVSGFPKPTIKWLFKNGNGKVNSVSCAKGPIVNEQRESSDNSNWLINSHCTIFLDTYDTYGQYWCSGCIEYAQNLSGCSSSLNSLPQAPEYVFLNVTGAPKIDQHFVPRVEQSANLDRTTVYVPFCANPKPADSGSYWLITNERVNMGERLDNILAQPIQKSLSSQPLCYEAPLLIDMPQNKDKSKIYQLVVSNSQGQLNEILPIGKYVVGNDTEDITSFVYTPAAYDPTGIGVGLAVLIVVLIGLCLCAYLWFKNKACFSSRKTKGKKADKYQSNLASTQLTVANEMSPEKPASGNENEPPPVPETLRLNGHKGEQTYVKSYDDFDLIKETDHTGRLSTMEEKEKMLPKTKDRKRPTDSAV